MTHVDRRSFLSGSAVAAGFLAAGGLPLASARAGAGAGIGAGAGAGLAVGADAPLLLHQNENPLGVSPAAMKAASGALPRGNRYPADEARELATKIAGIEGLTSAQVTVGVGSTAMIEAMVHAFADSGATVIAPAITYEDAEWYAQRRGMAYRTVAMLPGMVSDLAAMEALAHTIDGSVLVYLVSPNNPTGLRSPSDAIAAWVARAPDNVFFLIDEAYHEYVDANDYTSAAALVRDGHDNLMVTRTFSKIYGLAGLRVGYALAVPAVIRRLRQYYTAWNITPVAVAAATAALDDQDFVARSAHENAAARALVIEALDDMGLAYLPSEANFMLHETGLPQKAYRAAMRERHILVGRDFGLDGTWSRLSLGTVAETRYFVAALRALHG